MAANLTTLLNSIFYPIVLTPSSLFKAVLIVHYHTKNFRNSGVEYNFYKAEGPNTGGHVYCVEEVLITGSFWKKCC